MGTACASEEAFPVAERLSREVISLPLYPELTDAQQAHVIKTVREALEGDG